MTHIYCTSRNRFMEMTLSTLALPTPNWGCPLWKWLLTYYGSCAIDHVRHHMSQGLKKGVGHYDHRNSHSMAQHQGTTSTATQRINSFEDDRFTSVSTVNGHHWTEAAAYDISYHPVCSLMMVMNHIIFHGLVHVITHTINSRST